MRICLDLDDEVVELLAEAKEMFPELSWSQFLNSIVAQKIAYWLRHEAENYRRASRWALRVVRAVIDGGKE